MPKLCCCVMNAPKGQIVWVIILLYRAMRCLIIGIIGKLFKLEQSPTYDEHEVPDSELIFGLCCTVQYCILQYSTLQHSTFAFHTVLYCMKCKCKCEMEDPQCVGRNPRNSYCPTTGFYQYCLFIYQYCFIYTHNTLEAVANFRDNYTPYYTPCCEFPTRLHPPITPPHLCVRQS